MCRPRNLHKFCIHTTLLQNLYYTLRQLQRICNVVLAMDDLSWRVRHFRDLLDREGLAIGEEGDVGIIILIELSGGTGSPLDDGWWNSCFP